MTKNNKILIEKYLKINTMIITKYKVHIFEFDNLKFV